jgi:SWI/SNF-related matrix-associated actin-dependent regulator of chromatin subfamily A3
MKQGKPYVVFHNGKSFISCRIPYCRFDGQMSAKRRQETIARFSIPINSEPVVTPASSTRRTSSGKYTEDGLDGDDGSDYAPGMSEDEDFDMTASTQNSKGKGKAKAKGKGKKKANASFETEFDLVYGPNPKIMLISLKAVRNL